jgi:hypothetical protein
MDNDNGGVQFIATAFAGTRGLNDYAKDLMRQAQQPYRPEPPRISRAAYEKQTNDWIEALDAKFSGGPKCGCEPLHYALRLKVSDNLSGISPGADRTIGDFKGASDAQVPFTIRDGGAIGGDATLDRNVTGASTTRRQNAR